MITIATIWDKIREEINSGEIDTIDTYISRMPSNMPQKNINHIIDTYNLIVKSYEKLGFPLNEKEALINLTDVLEKEYKAGVITIDVGDIIGDDLAGLNLFGVGETIEEVLDTAAWFRKNWLWILIAVTIVIIIIIAVVYFLIIEPKSTEMMQMMMAAMQNV